MTTCLRDGHLAWFAFDLESTSREEDILSHSAVWMALRGSCDLMLLVFFGQSGFDA